MSVPSVPKPAKLVISLFMKDKRTLEPICRILTGKFGSVDMIGPWIPFDYTDYYKSEMGSPLFRRMLAFSDLVKQEDLAKIKIITNSIESEYAKGDYRIVNIDPGYMLCERFVLATGKKFTHRIYIGDGIYADLTLMYQKGAFRKLPWTYPDYADGAMLGFLEVVRRRYMADLKRSEKKHDKKHDRIFPG